MTNATATDETNRQYRVTKQTLSMHARRRDQLKWRAKTAEIILIICSTIFCVTTFSDQNLSQFLGLDPFVVRMILGVASVGAFIASLILLIVDWQGTAALHEDGFKRWSTVLELYRNKKQSDGTWPEQSKVELSTAYWNAAHNSIPIPERQFNRLKAHHLQKLEISKVVDSYPWCPQILLCIFFKMRDAIRAFKGILIRTEK